MVSAIDALTRYPSDSTQPASWLEYRQPLDHNTFTIEENGAPAPSAIDQALIRPPSGTCQKVVFNASRHVALLSIESSGWNSLLFCTSSELMNCYNGHNLRKQNNEKALRRTSWVSVCRWCWRCANVSEDRRLQANSALGKRRKNSLF